MSTIYNSSKTAETVNRAIDNNMGTTTTEQGASSAGLIISEDLQPIVQCVQGFDYSISEKTITGVPPLTFHAIAQNAIDWAIAGNTTVTGTPAPDDPATITGVGDYDNDNKCTISITNGDTTVAIDLSAVTSRRSIKKWILTGTENWSLHSSISSLFILYTNDYLFEELNISLCTHYNSAINTGAAYVGNNECCFYYGASTARLVYIKNETYTTIDDFKNYLALQYANGTPVTIYYVLAEPVTDVLNEPLQKIGDYADTVTGDLSETSIPLTWGYNTIDVDTTVTPSSMTINYKDD